MEVESTDVIRLILQYLRENNLTASFAALQEETSVALNVVDSTDAFVADIAQGRWDAVLQTLSQLRLPVPKLIDLYEQIIIELIEMREVGAARSMLRQTDPMILMRDRYPERYVRLEHLLSRTYFDPREAYPEGSDKEKRRNDIARAIATEVTTVPPSRLLALLGQALKWQQHQGLLPPGTAFDLFRGMAPITKVEAEAPPTTLANTIKLGKKTHAECARFSPDGQYFVTGSSDGFIEVWSPITGKLRKDLKYQAEDNYMLMEDSVTSLAFSRDSDMLVSTSADATFKVWKMSTGQCLRKFEKAHGQGITCVNFSRDGSQVVTGSFDNLIRVHGLKSGKMIKELRGHTSFVNEVVFNIDGTRIISVASDGLVKVWDSKTSEASMELHPSPIHSVHVLLTSPEQFVIGERSPMIYITTAKGQVVKTMMVEKKTESTKSSDVVSMAVGRGGFVHVVTEDGYLHSFNLETGRLEHSLHAHDQEIVGMAVHPHLNLVATYSMDGEVRLWKS